MSVGTSIPSEEALLKCLELEWQDHFQTRAQTWKALQIEAALAVALVGLDWQLDSAAATTLFGIVVVVAACFGIAVSLHHRRVEIRKFTHILNIEQKLGLHTNSLLPDVSVPVAIRWTDAFRWRKFNTALFILRMHVAILFFAALYVAARWLISAPPLAVTSAWFT